MTGDPLGWLGVADLVAERTACLQTITSLDDEQFERGPTLCAGWAPRDVLAHLIGVSDAGRYLRGGLRINAVNAAVVRDAHALSRAELTTRGEHWAAHPTAADRLGARLLIGDVAVHHRDVVRGVGLTRAVSPAAATAIFREGVLLSTGTTRNLLRYRVEPTTVGGRALGRGIRVRGPAEAVGMWLAGRRGIEAELDFGG